MISEEDRFPATTLLKQAAGQSLDGHSWASERRVLCYEDSSWPRGMVAVSELLWFLDVMTPDQQQQGQLGAC